MFQRRSHSSMAISRKWCRARLSQSDMASYLGYKGKSGYSNLENGKVKMTVEQLEQLITILSIPQEAIRLLQLQEEMETFLN